MKNMRVSRTATWFLILLLLGCGSQPFQCIPASGKVTYEDGSLISADTLVLTFLPLSPPIDAKTYPRPGMAQVDTATGEFAEIGTHKADDGLVCGKHKVTLAGMNGSPLPASIAPLEYADFAKTPLEVDTANRPFLLKVKKPSQP